MAARATRSKRPSAASSGSKPPEPIVFFIDRSLGRKIVAQALRDVGESVEIHDDHFVPDAKDELWLVEVGRRGWIVLTKDDRIRYRVTERTALAAAKVKAFVLTSTQPQGSEMADAFIRHYHESNDLSPSTGLRCLAGFQDKGKSRSCNLSGELAEEGIHAPSFTTSFRCCQRQKARMYNDPSGLKQRMIAERFGGLDEGLMSRDCRAIREKIETEPKIRNGFQDFTSLSA